MKVFASWGAHFVKFYGSLVYMYLTCNCDSITTGSGQKMTMLSINVTIQIAQIASFST